MHDITISDVAQNNVFKKYMNLNRIKLIIYNYVRVILYKKTISPYTYSNLFKQTHDPFNVLRSK